MDLFQVHQKFKIHLEYRIMKFDYFLNSGVFFLLMLKQELFTFNFIWVFTLPLQTLCLILITIQRISRQIEQSSPNRITQAFLNIWDKINSNDSRFYLLICYSVCSLILINTFFFFLWKGNSQKLQKRPKLIPKLIAICSFAVIIMQLTLFNSTFSVASIILDKILEEKQSLESYYIFPALLSCIGIIAVGTLNYGQRMMGQFYFLFLILSSLKEKADIIGTVLGILACLYLLKGGQSSYKLLFTFNLRKILHLTFIFYLFWKLLLQLPFPDSNSAHGTPAITLIYLLVGIIVSLLLAFAIFEGQINSSGSLIIKITMCIQNIEKNSQVYWSKTQALEILDQCFLNHQKRDSLKIMIPNIKRIQQWDTSVWWELIFCLAIQFYKKEDTLQYGVEVAKCMLSINNNSAFQILCFFQELVMKHQGKSLRASYELAKLMLKIEKHCSPQPEEYSVTQALRHLEKLTQQFYALCSEQISCIYRFWGKVVCDRLSLQESEGIEDIIVSFDVHEETQQMIAKIREGLEKIECVAEQIGKISTADKQMRVCSVIRRLSISSQDENELQPQEEAASIKLGKQKAEEPFSGYFEVVDSKIVNISVKLAIQLGYKKVEVIGQALSFLILDPFEVEIENMIKEQKQQPFSLNHLTPLKCIDDSTVLKEIQIYLEIDFTFGYRIFFKVLSSQQNQSPLLGYNILTNSIDFYNYHFADVFCLNREKLNGKIKNNCLASEQIIAGIKLNNKNIQDKLVQGVNETQFDCRLARSTLGDKTAHREQDIRLSLVQKQNNLMILKILKGHKSNRDQEVTDFDERPLYSDEKWKKILTKNKKLNIFNKQKVDDEQQFDEIYCPIEHPYNAKISNKKYELIKEQKFGYSRVSVWLVYLGVFLIVVQTIIYLQRTGDFRRKIMENSLKTLNKFDLYSSLIHSYQSFFEIQIIKREKAQLQNSGVNIAFVLGLLEASLLKGVNNFQQKYLLYLKELDRKVVNYTIKFGRFQIKTDTTKTNLFDFENKILQYDLFTQSSQKSFQFLQENLQSIIKLIEDEGKSQQFISIFAQNQYKIFYFISGTMVITILFLLITSLILRLKIIQVKKLILRIFNNADYDCLFQIFQNIKCSVKSYIMQISDSVRTQQEKYDKLNSFTFNMREKQKKKLRYKRDQNQQRTELLKTQNLFNKVQQNLQELDGFGQKLKRKQLGLLLYLGAIISISVIFFIQVTYLQNMVKEEESILAFKLENKRICQNLVLDILQNQNQILMGTHKKQLTKIDSLNQKKLPPFFSSFQQLYFNKTSKNLCESVTNFSKLSFSVFECRKIGRGILKYGLAKTLQNVGNVLKYSVSRGGWVSFNPYSKLIVAQEIFYSQSLIQILSEQVLQQLRVYQERYRLKQKSILDFIGLSGILFSICIFLGNIWLKIHVMRASQTSKSSFLIMPSKMLLQRNILDFLREKDLLKKISEL